jgi:hypothetical protein
VAIAASSQGNVGTHCNLSFLLVTTSINTIYTKDARPECKHGSDPNDSTNPFFKSVFPEFLPDFFFFFKSISFSVLVGSLFEFFSHYLFFFFLNLFPGQDSDDPTMRESFSAGGVE